MPIMRVTCYNDDDDDDDDDDNDNNVDDNNNNDDDNDNVDVNDDNDQLQLRKLDRPAAATSKQDIRAEEQRDEVKERHTKE